ncbi:bactofilin family protein [Campylobacter fetus]|uniref:bactofilin family protein n=1 Tax=Campylobacter fetus TaxID=196 RepID=UPI000FCCCD01|nr:polymer-forming cytoskeletal protein [Campylobacter fetus]RUT51115.1 hypothetical protein BWK67_00930 [Campylobacter fetus]RUT51842.1 hypothetical protein BWK51_00930 [Campylobacter fetus]
MAVFSKNPSRFNAQTTIISEGAYIQGELTLKSMLYVDGKVDGAIRSDNTVVIGKNGNIKGVIFAQKVVINGIFEGNIDAEFVDILNGSFVSGDILAANLSIESGAKFNGKSSTKNVVKSLENLEIIDAEASSASKNL